MNKRQLCGTILFMFFINSNFSLFITFAQTQSLESFRFYSTQTYSGEVEKCYGSRNSGIFI